MRKTGLLEAISTAVAEESQATKDVRNFIIALRTNAIDDAEFDRQFNAVSTGLKAYWRNKGFCRNADEANELSQKFYLHLYERLAKVELSDNPWGYLKRMAHNFAIDHCRLDNRRREHEMPDITNEDGTTMTDRYSNNDHETIFGSINNLETLEILLAPLSQHERDLVWMRADGHSFIYIAEFLGIDYDNARAQYSRALKKARPGEIAAILLEESKAAEKALVELKAYIRRNNFPMASQPAPLPMKEVINHAIL
jgi:RNA polymerase sigma factor (sigma-70 family)